MCVATWCDPCVWLVPFLHGVSPAAVDTSAELQTPLIGVSVRWRCFVVLGRRWLSVNSERIVGLARARNQRHHHYRER